MEITSAILKVRQHRKFEKFAEVNLSEDSGAAYSLIPGKILDQTDIEFYKKMSFSLAGATTLNRKKCSAYFEYEGEEGPPQVIFIEESDEPLPGSIILTSPGDVSNPFTRTLHPVRMWMNKLKK